MLSTEEKRVAFHKLHDSGCFVLPNPWDIGSAKALQDWASRHSRRPAPGLHGRSAKPTTGLRWTILSAMWSACAAVDLPINADFENGFADEPEGVAAHVSRAAKTGYRRLIDRGCHRATRQNRFTTSIWRSSASAPQRKAIDTDRSNVLLVGRCEAFLSRRSRSER